MNDKIGWVVKFLTFVGVSGAAITITIFSSLVVVPAVLPGRPVSAVSQDKPGLPDWGDVREVEVDGCQYLLWIYDIKGIGHSSMVHKGNCTNHDDKKSESPEKDEYPNKHSI